MLTLAFVSCEDDVTDDNGLTEYVSLEERRIIELDPGVTGTVETKVYATPSNVSRTVNLYFDSSTTIDTDYVSMPSTITIPAGASEVPFEITVENYGLTAAGKLIAVGIESQEGMNLGLSASADNANSSVPFGAKLLKVTARDYCEFNSVNLTIVFDNYPDETAWELYDASFNLVASAGFDATGTNITGFLALGYAARSTYSTDFCLESGDYTFVIYDKFADGLYTSSSIQGNYVLKTRRGQVLAEGRGNFGSYQDTSFTLQ